MLIRNGVYYAFRLSTESLVASSPACLESGCKCDKKCEAKKNSEWASTLGNTGPNSSNSFLLYSDTNNRGGLCSPCAERERERWSVNREDFELCIRLTATLLDFCSSINILQSPLLDGMGSFECKFLFFNWGDSKIETLKYNNNNNSRLNWIGIYLN